MSLLAEEVGWEGDSLMKTSSVARTLMKLLEAFSCAKNAVFPFTRSSPMREVWIEWEYTAEEWKAADRLDWQRARCMFLLTIVVVCTYLGIGVYQLLSSELVEARRDTPVVIVLSGILSWLLLLLPALVFPWLYVWRPYREAWKRHMARQSRPRTVTLGTALGYNLFLKMADTSLPLHDDKVYLIGVKCSARSLVVLRLRRFHPCGRSSWWDTVYLLVPSYAVEQVVPLVERLRNDIMIKR